MSKTLITIFILFLLNNCTLKYLNTDKIIDEQLINLKSTKLNVEKQSKTEILIIGKKIRLKQIYNPVFFTKKSCLTIDRKESSFKDNILDLETNESDVDDKAFDLIKDLSLELVTKLKKYRGK